MITTPFRMNSKDFSAYVQKNGVSIAYSYRKGLPDKNTNDGVRHVDLGPNKRLVTVNFNPQPEDICDLILSEYRSGLINLTVRDNGETIMILTEPTSAATKTPIMTKAGVTWFQISQLTFEEL